MAQLATQWHARLQAKLKSHVGPECGKTNIVQKRNNCDEILLVRGADYIRLGNRFENLLNRKEVQLEYWNLLLFLVHTLRDRTHITPSR